MNLGQLQRDEVQLYPGEVIAIVRAVCDQGAWGAQPDGMWITPGGEVLIRESVADLDPAAPLGDVARLIEGLLPPFSEDPDYALPISLRLLPARIRRTIEPALTTPRELLDAIQAYETGAPSQVLQRLALRAAAIAAGSNTADGAADDSFLPDRGETRSAVATIVAIDASDDSLDQFSAEPTATALGPAAAGDERIEVIEVPTAAPITMAESSPPIVVAAAALPRPRSWFPLSALGAAISLGVSAYGGYWLISQVAKTSAQTPTNVAAPSPSRQATSSTEVVLPPASLDSRALPSAPPSERAEGVAAPTVVASPKPANPDPAQPPASRAEDSALPVPNAAAAAASPEPPDSDEKTDRALADGTRALVLPVADGAFSPSFASTGTALFFHSGRRREGRLLEADLDEKGAPLQIVTVLDEAAKNYHPRVSPDERQIAFDSDRDGERGVYVADRDGKNISRVSGNGFAALPSWSPDMKWLAIVRAEPDRPRVWNLWLRNVATGELRRLTSYRIGQTWAASWFPDARRLCYSHEDRLVILDIGTGATREFPSPVPGHLVRTPAVSPEGRRIVFQVFRDGVWMVDLENGSMRRVLDDPTAEEFAWNPRGSRLAYHSRKDGAWRIWVTAPPS